MKRLDLIFCFAVLPFLLTGCVGQISAARPQPLTKAAVIRRTQEAFHRISNYHFQQTMESTSAHAGKYLFTSQTDVNMKEGARIVDKTGVRYDIGKKEYFGSGTITFYSATVPHFGIDNSSRSMEEYISHLASWTFHGSQLLSGKQVYLFEQSCNCPVYSPVSTRVNRMLWGQTTIAAFLGHLRARRQHGLTDSPS